MKAIPTLYKGIWFRSRLEAKWAAFFDGLKWKWEYEPIDFDGWIPDFAIYGKEQVTYVEVKPVVKFPETIADEIDSSRCSDEVLIVGQNPFLPDLSDDDCFGWLREGMFDVTYPEDGVPVGYYEATGEPVPEFDEQTGESVLIEWSWDEAVFGVWEAGNGKLGFCHYSQSYRDRISGGYDGGSHGSFTLDLEMIRLKWARAKNKVQWKGSRR